MTPLTQEWADKAEGDFATAQREFRVRKAPNYDAVCFHAQQCAEKYLKARLQEAGISFSKTHHLPLLLDLLLPVEPTLAVLRSPLLTLNVYAVHVRYPGETADKEMARESLAACQDVRQLLRQSLGLAP